ncbi:hypothetical protein Tco_0043448, partial [Tanacetum coccineum]
VEDYSDIMLEHLIELEITSFINANYQLDFVRLILARSPVLKKVRIFPHSIIPKKEKSKIKSQILRDSVIYPCASPELCDLLSNGNLGSMVICFQNFYLIEIELTK